MRLPGSLFTTRTLFPVRCKSCFILLFLAKPYYFDTVLLLVYVISKLMYPNCTQDEILPKVVTRRNFLKQNYVHINICQHPLRHGSCQSCQMRYLSCQSLQLLHAICTDTTINTDTLFSFRYQMHKMYL